MLFQEKRMVSISGIFEFQTKTYDQDNPQVWEVLLEHPHRISTTFQDYEQQTCVVNRANAALCLFHHVEFQLVPVPSESNYK